MDRCIGRFRYKGGWSSIVTIPGTGKRQQLYGKTKREVQEKAGEFRLKLNQGITGVDSREQVGSLIERWLEEVADLRLRPKTVENYRSAARKHIIPDLGKIPLNKLSTIAIQSWVSNKRRAGASPHVIRNSLAILRRCLRSAVGWQLIAANPAIGVEIPPLPERDYRTLTPTEYKRLLAAVDETQFHTMLLVEMFTGLRKGGNCWASSGATYCGVNTLFP